MTGDESEAKNVAAEHGRESQREDAQQRSSRSILGAGNKENDRMREHNQTRDNKGTGPDSGKESRTEVALQQGALSLVPSSTHSGQEESAEHGRQKERRLDQPI